MAREQDCFLPIANVTRLMKRSLPDDAKIAKDAKQCMQECVSEFISFITSEASDKCLQEKRKTINGDDLLWAMQSLGFDAYIPPLRHYLARYRQEERPSRRTSSTSTTTSSSTDAALAVSSSQPHSLPTQTLNESNSDSAQSIFYNPNQYQSVSLNPNHYGTLQHENSAFGNLPIQQSSLEQQAAAGQLYAQPSLNDAQQQGNSATQLSDPNHDQQQQTT